MKQIRLKDETRIIDSCWNCLCIGGRDGQEFCVFDVSIPCDYENIKNKKIHSNCPLEDYYPPISYNIFENDDEGE